MYLNVQVEQDHLQQQLPQQKFLQLKLQPLPQRLRQQPRHLQRKQRTVQLLQVLGNTI